MHKQESHAGTQVAAGEGEVSSNEAAAQARECGGTTHPEPNGGEGGGVSVGGNLAGTGAAPSNTAPDNCIEGSFKAIRWGVDSLYLSYPGDIGYEIEDRLLELKKLAQSDNDFFAAKAQYPIEGHLFEVKDKGASCFPYVMEDGAFRIQLSRPGKRLPMAYVKLSAGYLAFLRPLDAEKPLRAIIEALGEVQGEAQVSRIDLFVDFVWTGSMEWPRQAWITRASNIHQHAQDECFTGWSIGLGSIMSARLYDKRLEIEKSGKDYLMPLWREAGWQDSEPVWRLEFQFKREVLAQFKLGGLTGVINHLNGLWSYATTEWLRLAVPSDADKTRSRWAIHHLWGWLSSIDWESDGGPLSRAFQATRLPDENRMMAMGLGSITGYMAARKIANFQQGLQAYLEWFHATVATKALLQGLSLEEYVSERVAAKARKFNTLLNEPEETWEAMERARAAEAYRRARDGE